MTDIAPWWWIVFTVAAAAAQTARNAMQKSLTARLGTLGATHVRFLYGLPFALLAFALQALVTGGPLPVPGPAFAGWVVVGALSQIAATALMLAAMQQRSFVVATAYVKTEPVQVALFALVFLSERLGPIAIAAIVIATAGVLMMSWPAAPAGGAAPAFGWKPLGLGLSAGAGFAASAVGFKGAIVALGDGPFHLRATETLVCGLLLQVVVLSGWLAWRRPGVVSAVLAAWRPSLAAGFMGAAASQGWFLAFAVASTAQVRTLGLIEILFAQVVSRSLFRQRSGWRELAGIALVVAGVGLLVAGA